MCEKFAKICGRGSPERVLFSERRSNRRKACANQVLCICVFFFLVGFFAVRFCLFFEKLGFVNGINMGFNLLFFSSGFRDGKSRQFAFIGFRTEHEAEEAIKYFNKSYLDTCRITCEVCVCFILSVCFI